jgi:hypothetical protein
VYTPASGRDAEQNWKHTVRVAEHWRALGYRVEVTEEWR